jgi:Mg/Co/Ni transporter MgtE
MEPAEAQEFRQLLEFEEDSAGALMTTDFLSLSPGLTAAEAIDALRRLAADAETIYYLYLLQEDDVLIGVLSLRELIIADPQTRLSDLMTTRVVSVHPTDSQEKVAELVNKYNLLAIPVITEDGKMLGIITIDDVLELLIPDRSSLETFSRFLVSKISVRR